jgi:FkbM family methyltransferase
MIKRVLRHARKAVTLRTAPIVEALGDWHFRRKYGPIDIFRLLVDGHEITFSTKKQRAKRWFFPRYAGGRLHEENVTRFLIQQLETAKCFVDVGSCLGYYAIIASKFLSHGIIFAFEMDAVNHAILIENVRLNGCTNVHAIHMAISDQSGAIVYDKHHDQRLDFTEYSILARGADFHAAQLESVEAVSLDDFFIEKDITPDVLKIDVEGAEMNVLTGMSELIRYHAPRLIIEVHSQKLPQFGHSAEEVVGCLKRAGYSLWQIDEVSAESGGEILRPMGSLDSLTTPRTFLFASRALTRITSQD